MDAQATYGLRFGRYRYAWKAKKISFPIQLESLSNTEAFFMASKASYPDVRSMAFSRSIVLCCLSYTNIMFFPCSHVSILC